VETVKGPQFAKVGGAHVAYRTWGDGPPDLLYFEEVHVDMLEDEPRLARWLKPADGEVWVSRTVADLIIGSGIGLTDRGEHELKGVPGTWRLYEVTS
jgi:hypothetical protein